MTAPVAEPAAAPYRDPARQSFLRRQGTRNRSVASISTVVALVLLGFFVTQTPGWPAVHKSFFDGAAFPGVKYLEYPITVFGPQPEPSHRPETRP